MRGLRAVARSSLSGMQKFGAALGIEKKRNGALPFLVLGSPFCGMERGFRLSLGSVLSRALALYSPMSLMLLLPSLVSLMSLFQTKHKNIDAGFIPGPKKKTSI